MLNFLCRPTCIFCDAVTNRDLDLCSACENDLPVLQNYCLRCAEPLPEGQTVCGPCLSKDLSVIRTTALFYYQTPVDQLITNFKFKNNLVSAKILGGLLGNRLIEQYSDQTKPEVIIPVPLHPSRLRERGYNQALELAKPIAEKLHLPIDRFSVKRIRPTAPQLSLSAKEREYNIKQAFSVTSDFCYSYVAVIDDVITTGSTVMELCKMLLTAGVQKIDIWCCAKNWFKNSIM